MDQRLKSTVDRKLKSTALAAMFALSLLGQAVPSGAQTKVTPPKNGFTPAQDVELGQKAAAEVRQQMPLVKKADVQQYIQQIGERLVSAISPELRQPAFRYSFQVVNASDINAFALPGGPMFVNRGMIAAAKNEGQVAGVMAHELSHVVLRHGTAQATKAQKYQFGELAGAIIGAVVGGTAGQVIAQGTQFGLGTAFLRFSREFERDADLEGSHIMARAGYDPRDMAAMFKTIEQQDKSRAPQWLSDHPNPGNRAEYITREARLLQVEGGRDSGQLQTMKAELERLPPAQTTEQIMRNAQRQQGGGANGESGVGTSGALSPNVEPPSSSFKTYDVGNVFRVSVPANWRQLQGNTNSVTFAPEGGFGSAQGSSVFTHGVEMGIAVAQASGDLRAATDQLVQGLAQSNPGLQAEGNSQPVSFAGRQGLQVRLRNVSEATGKPEVVVLTTALLDDGNLFYSIGVAPQDEFGQYGRTLQRVNQSVQLEK
jgi:Zn-dependent protease with chaperone function